MRVTSVLATLLLVSAASAAAAQEWRPLDTLYMWPKGEIYSQRVNVPGPIHALQVRAHGGTAHCLTVRANFRDDETRILYRGDIDEQAPVLVPLEAGDTSVRSVMFRCSGPESVTLEVMADPGRFAPEWSSNAAWNGAWTTLHNLGSTLANSWNYVGEVRFQSRFEETEIATPESGTVAVALMPLRFDARCRSAEAILPDGSSLPLALDRDDFLAHDQYNKVELPADARALETLTLECRATNGGNVRMRVYASS